MRQLSASCRPSASLANLLGSRRSTVGSSLGDTHLEGRSGVAQRTVAERPRFSAVALQPRVGRPAPSYRPYSSRRRTQYGARAPSSRPLGTISRQRNAKHDQRRAPQDQQRYVHGTSRYADLRDDRKNYCYPSTGNVFGTAPGSTRPDSEQNCDYVCGTWHDLLECRSAKPSRQLAGKANPGLLTK